MCPSGTRVNKQTNKQTIINFSDNPLTGLDYTSALKTKQSNFNLRFEGTFGLEQKGFNDKQIKFAQAAMSNMVGGIGYFYGHSLVQ
jgi:mannosyl-oligosaccharide glucosidase